MTEVGEMPQYADVLVRPDNTPRQLENIARFLASQDLKRDSALPAVQYETLAANIPVYSAELKRKFPGIPEEVIESVVDVTFGPIRLPEGSSSTEVNPEAYRFLETSAKMQHAYAHHVVAAGRPDADPEYAKALFPRVAIIDYLARRPALRERELSQFWNGVKAEAAVIKALEKAGFNVELPDYTQAEYDSSGNDVPDAKRQVLQWDVLSGIDMVATKEEKVLFVDAKGRLNLPNGRTREDTEVFIERAKRFPADLSRRFMKQVRNGNVRHATIVVPTHYNYLSGISSTDFDFPDKRVVMRDFARSAGEDDIIEKLK